MISNNTSLLVNCNNLLLPWECNDQSFNGNITNGYYYMVTIKNNTSPKKEYTDPKRYCLQANRLFLKGFHHIKSAFELDSKDQLHLHLILRHDKNIHRVNTSNYLKSFEKTFVHDIKPIETDLHLTNALAYLNPSSNALVIRKYEYLYYPNDACDFIETVEEQMSIKYKEAALNLQKNIVTF